MMKKIRIGIIGSGYIAQEAHIPAFRAMEDVEIAALLGKRPEHTAVVASRFGIEYAAKNLDDFLKRDLDAVALLTPKTVRGEFLQPLLDAGLDVLVEKPLASTLAECEQMVNASKKAGRMIMVVFNRRYSPIYRQGIEAFDGCAPQHILALKCREFQEYRATLENAIHMLDLFRYILGECKTVEAAAHGKDPFYEELCTAQLTFENGSIALLSASRQAGQWCERMEMFGGNQTVIMEPPKRLRIILAEHEERRDMAQLYKGLPNAMALMGFYDCDRHFIDCVKSRQVPLTSAEDAYQTHMLLNCVLEKAGLPDLTRKWEE